VGGKTFDGLNKKTKKLIKQKEKERRQKQIEHTRRFRYGSFGYKLPILQYSHKVHAKKAPKFSSKSTFGTPRKKTTSSLSEGDVLEESKAVLETIEEVPELSENMLEVPVFDENVSKRERKRRYKSAERLLKEPEVVSEPVLRTATKSSRNGAETASKKPKPLVDKNRFKWENTKTFFIPTNKRDMENLVGPMLSSSDFIERDLEDARNWLATEER
jgi:hypothetical protein